MTKEEVKDIVREMIKEREITFHLKTKNDHDYVIIKIEVRIDGQIIQSIENYIIR